MKTCDYCSDIDTCDELCADMEKNLSELCSAAPALYLVGDEVRFNSEWTNEGSYKAKFVEESNILNKILSPLRGMDKKQALIYFGAYYLEMSVSQLCKVFKLKRSRIYALLRDSSKEKVG